MPRLPLVFTATASLILLASPACFPCRLPCFASLQVRSVTAASHEAAALQPDDIVLRIDGVEVGNDGSVPFRHGERVDFK